MEWDERVKEANIRLRIKKVLMSLQRKKEEITTMDNDINVLRESNRDKEEVINQLKLELNSKKETYKEAKSKQLIGNKAFDSLSMMIKSDRKDTCITDKEYLNLMKKRTEDINRTFREKYSELEGLFRIYSDLMMKRRTIEVKTNINI